jgi:hypothetical protein
MRSFGGCPGGNLHLFVDFSGPNLNLLHMGFCSLLQEARKFYKQARCGCPLLPAHMCGGFSVLDGFAWLQLGRCSCLIWLAGAAGPTAYSTTVLCKATLHGMDKFWGLP